MSTNKNVDAEDYDVDDEVDALLAQMSEQLSDIIKDKKLDAPVMVGIHSAGVWVAERLHQSLNIKEPLGKLNINFYRDDFSRIGLHPQIKASELPFSLEDKHIILVDDVLFTGRTIRAAMNELFDYGRPASITLAVLIDRGNRELPVEANVVGFRREMDRNSYFKLTKADNKLELNIINK